MRRQAEKTRGAQAAAGLWYRMLRFNTGLHLEPARRADEGVVVDWERKRKREQIKLSWLLL